jgi:CRISPR/Cas system-associated exonuclease Cas4 (RecB family)
MKKSNPKEFLSENVKSKFRKIKKKLQLRKKIFKFEKSDYNVFFNKNEFVFYFFIKVNKEYSYSKKEKKALKDDIIFIKEILENLEEEYLLHHNDLNQEDENERIFGFTH